MRPKKTRRHLDRKKIIAVIDTTFAVVKRKPEKKKKKKKKKKNQACTGFEPYDLQLNHEIYSNSFNRFSPF